MMNVEIVRMRVPHRLVAMPMRMRFTGRIVRPMLMVIVVTMPVLVFHGLVAVLMITPFGQMQKAEGHQHPGHGELDRESLAKRWNRQHSADERSEREIRTCAALLRSCRPSTNKADLVTEEICYV